MLPRHRSKMTKTEKKVISWLCLIAFLGIIAGAIANFVWFKINPEPRFRPLGSQVPDKEILFTLDVYEDLDDTIGFINSDGTELETRSYEIPVPLFFQKIPLKQYDSFAGRIFTWSLDGQSVGGINPTWGYNRQGYPVVIESDGSIVFCEPSESIIAENGILVISPNMVMAIELFENDDERQDVVVFNMKSCQIERIVYSATGDENLSFMTYSSNGLLALEFTSTSFSGVRVFDGEMNTVMEIAGATRPAFSKDGLKLAYINDSNKVCINSIFENSSPSCFGDAFFGVSWSPDSKWLVYANSKDQILKLEISTGKATVIGHGVWPDWRPITPSQ
jgi:WD40 repeat protein